jgi:hypothetical protein
VPELLLGMLDEDAAPDFLWSLEEVEREKVGRGGGEWRVEEVRLERLDVS